MSEAPLARALALARDFAADLACDFSREAAVYRWWLARIVRELEAAQKEIEKDR